MPKTTKQRKGLSKYEVKKYKKTLWPATPVEDEEELGELLFNHFDDSDEETQWTTFSAYTRKVGGWGWLNALHSFDLENPDRKDTPLTYVLEREPDEWRFVGFLLGLGADPNIRNSRGEPPLYVFIANDAVLRRH